MSNINIVTVSCENGKYTVLDHINNRTYVQTTFLGRFKSLDAFDAWSIAETIINDYERERKRKCEN